MARSETQRRAEIEERKRRGPNRLCCGGQGRKRKDQAIVSEGRRAARSPLRCRAVAVRATHRQNSLLGFLSTPTET